MTSRALTTLPRWNHSRLALPTQCSVGVLASSSPGPVIYGPDVKSLGRRQLPLPEADEPAARDFFAEVARRTGRSIQP
jgi:hypothetical protein